MGGRCGVLLLSIFLTQSCQRAPDPADTIQRAYNWYVRTLKRGEDPLAQDKGELAPFVTGAFLASIDNLRQGIGASALPDPRSFDARLHVQDVQVNGDSARARVTVAGRIIGVHELSVRLAREASGWKIDDVKLMENDL